MSMSITEKTVKDIRRKTRRHGGFVHLETRGYKARW